MDNDKLIMVIISKEEAEKAYVALDGMIKTFPPLMRRINFEGKGESDEVECRNDLQLAMNAVLTLISLFDASEEAETNE